MAKVRSACRQNDNETARKIMEDWIADDEKFANRFKLALLDVQQHDVNYCDPFLLLQIEKIINRPEVKGPG